MTTFTPEGRVRSGSGQGYAFAEILADVYAQIDAAAFDAAQGPMAETAARLIAELRLLPPDTPVRIDGGTLPARTVCEIFSLLTYEDVAAVIARFEALPYAVRHIKTYLRTSLYNAALEGAAFGANAYGKDHGT